MKSGSDHTLSFLRKMALVLSQTLTEDEEAKLQKLIDSIPEILKSTDNPEYDEIYGYRIAPDSAEHVEPIIRNEILLKFLISDEYNVETTGEKIKNTLNWRNKFRPLSAAYAEKYDADLEKLGVITDYKGNKDNFLVVTWNLYANLKNPKKLFAQFGVGVDSKETSELPGTMFLRWRIGIMERSLALLDFTDPDNLKVAQVHDYNNVSMFRMDPGMKAATKEIISIFGDNYPELLSKKYFINVPILMGWVFAFFKATGLMSAATLKKFEMLNHGDLSLALGANNLPKDYNGGVENAEVANIFVLAVTDIKVPAYGEVLEAKLKVEKPVATETVAETATQTATETASEPATEAVAETTQLLTEEK